MTSEVDPQDLIAELGDRYMLLRDQCLFQSSQRVAKEMKQIAKSEGMLVQYLSANHRLMNGAQSLMQPEYGAEVAIESIAILESEDRARSIEPDYHEGHYEYMIHRMSSCAYDNLARHVAQKEGYNSDGVHDCIADGLQVCRRTGKLECISCFREYATDVYVAFDDLEMAHHHASAVLQNQVRDEDDGTDRRWVGAKDLVLIYLLQGQIDAALDQCLRALELSKSYHSPVEAQIDSAMTLDRILLMLDRQEEFESTLRPFDIAPSAGANIPIGEYPTHELAKAQRDATASCCSGHFAEAIDVLTESDQKASRSNCLDEWFTNRVQLIATHLLAGNRTNADRLARQLEDKAKTARDWLRLRQIKALIDGETTVSPLGQPVAFRSGPFATTNQHPSIQIPPTAENEDASSSAESETNPENGPSSCVDVANDDQTNGRSSAVSELVNEIRSLFLENRRNEADNSELVARVLQISISDFETPRDACQAVYLGKTMAIGTGQAVEIWKWCESFIDHYSDNASFVSVYAETAFAVYRTLEYDGGDPDQVISLDRIEEFYRRSLDLDPGNAQNFASAGEFYFSVHKTGDAERCLARGFRLARDNHRIALQLSEIYSESDRTADALNVLDMCIREGSEEPALYWHAAMLAVQLARYQIVISYMQRYEELEPGEAWTHYYIALGHLECGDYTSALAALEAEQERAEGTMFGIETLKTIALRDRDSDEFRAQLDRVLGIPLRSVVEMTRTGIESLVGRLFAMAQTMSADDKHRRQIETLGLMAGIVPDSYFESLRERRTKHEGVSFYICTFEQPLDSSWAEHPGCMPHEEHWEFYLVRFGVLARTDSEAGVLASSFQDQCFPLEAKLVKIELEGEGYEERPGVVWQSAHFNPNDFMPDAEWENDDD